MARMTGSCGSWRCPAPPPLGCTAPRSGGPRMRRKFNSVIAFAQWSWKVVCEAILSMGATCMGLFKNTNGPPGVSPSCFQGPLCFSQWQSFWYKFCAKHVAPESDELGFSHSSCPSSDPVGVWTRLQGWYMSDSWSSTQGLLKQPYPSHYCC